MADELRRPLLNFSPSVLSLSVMPVENVGESGGEKVQKEETPSPLCFCTTVTLVMESKTAARATWGRSRLQSWTGKARPQRLCERQSLLFS